MRTISTHRANRLAAQHATTLHRLFTDYPPLRAQLTGPTGEPADDPTDDVRVPLSTLVTALGY